MSACTSVVMSVRVRTCPYVSVRVRTCPLPCLYDVRSMSGYCPVTVRLLSGYCPVTVRVIVRRCPDGPDTKQTPPSGAARSVVVGGGCANRHHPVHPPAPSHLTAPRQPAVYQVSGRERERERGERGERSAQRAHTFPLSLYISFGPTIHPFYTTPTYECCFVYFA